MQHPEADFWLSGLLGLSAVMFSLLLHTLFFFIPEQEPPVVNRVEFQVLKPKAAPPPPKTENPPDDKRDDKLTSFDKPFEKTDEGLKSTPAEKKHTDANGEGEMTSSDWRSRHFRPMRKPLHERNRLAEIRMKERGDLLARTASKMPWPKASDETEVAICTPKKTIALDVNTRSIRHWAAFLPSALFPKDYAEELQQIVGKNQKRSLGRVQRFALPKQFLELPLDEPKDVVLLMGSEDIRCALTVTFSFGEQAPFPIRLLQVPLRIVQPDGNVSLHNVDIDFNDDGRFSMTPSANTSTQMSLPFQKGRIEQTRQLAATFNGWKTMVELSFRALR
ncbi:MAG: hypothetical protein GY822_20250 [Deltaproteobacteria bacterium]|nr:hypothetical protein [Deltaproteobacteria bacterium]